LSCVGFFSIVAGIIAALFPNALPSIGSVLVLVVLLVSIGYGLYQSWPRPVRQEYKSPNTEINVVVGDLFEQEGNIVVGMTSTFDTEIPNIIDERGVQAQLLSRVYRNDRNSLDAALNKALAHSKSVGEFESRHHKPGKQVIYPIGTVATVEYAIRQFYFCVAYTNMNEKNEARGTIDGIWRSLNSLWDEVRAKGNSDPISIAVIGGGQARISQYFPAQDSIRFIALSYMFASRREKVTSRLNIVVRPQDVSNLDMLELQAFLRSLRPS
jgi:hypothetical protein